MLSYVVDQLSSLYKMGTHFEDFKGTFLVFLCCWWLACIYFYLCSYLYGPFSTQVRYLLTELYIFCHFIYLLVFLFYIMSI